MPRLLKSSLLVLGSLFAAASGYWYGIQRANEAYSEHFMSEAFTREYHEARHDLGIVRLLAENKHDQALSLAQYRYYSRLMLAADAAAKSSNPNLKKMLHVSLEEAKELQKTAPFQFPTEKEQQQWVALTKPSR